MRFLPLGLIIVSAMLLTGCTGASTRDETPGSVAEVSTALRAAVIEMTDEETAYLLDDPNGIIQQVAVDLVNMCAGGDPIGMGLSLLRNYEMGEVIAAGWAVACPGETFPG